MYFYLNFNVCLINFIKKIAAKFQTIDALTGYHPFFTLLYIKSSEIK
jgi:hypothetical protein